MSTRDQSGAHAPTAQSHCDARHPVKINRRASEEMEWREQLYEAIPVSGSRVPVTEVIEDSQGSTWTSVRTWRCLMGTEIQSSSLRFSPSVPRQCRVG